MAAIDKRSNGRWKVRMRNRRAPTLSKTFTRKADAININNINLIFSCIFIN